MAEAAVRGGEASSHPPTSQRAPLHWGGQLGPTGRWAGTQQEEGHLLCPDGSELPPAGGQLLFKGSDFQGNLASEPRAEPVT